MSTLPGAGSCRKLLGVHQYQSSVPGSMLAVCPPAAAGAQATTLLEEGDVRGSGRGDDGRLRAGAGVAADAVLSPDGRHHGGVELCQRCILPVGGVGGVAEVVVDASEVGNVPGAASCGGAGWLVGVVVAGAEDALCDLTGRSAVS